MSICSGFGTAVYPTGPPALANATEPVLVPVIFTNEKGSAKLVGTILVSGADEPFTEDNPEHVKIANAIKPAGRFGLIAPVYPHL